MTKKLQLTKRGKIVLLIAYALGALLALILLVWVSSNVWWTGSGYCFGSASKCLGGGL